MSITVIGFFKDRENAIDAVEQLTNSGFNDGDIDVSHNASVTSDNDRILTEVESGSDAGNIKYNRTADRNKTPDRNYEGDRNRTVDGNYEIDRNRSIDGNYEGDRNRSIDGNYEGDRYRSIDGNYEGDRNRSIDGNYEGDRNSEADHKNEGNAITRFFNSLFGNDSDNANRYSAISQKATSIVTVHAAGTEQAEEAANILDASGAMDIDEGELAEHTHDDVIAGSADYASHHRAGTQRVSTEVSGRSTQHYADQIQDHTAPATSKYTEPVDTERMSEGLTEADLEEAGIDPADIVTAENAAAHFEIENETAPGGIAPGITGAPVSGNLTTAQEHYNSVNAEHNNRYNQHQSTANRGRSRIIRGRVEDEHRLREDHTRVNRRNTDRLPD